MLDVGSGLFWIGLAVGVTLGLLLVWLVDRVLDKHWRGRHAFLRSMSTDEETDKKETPPKKWVS